MLKRPFKSVIARIAIVALALSLVFPFIPAALADGHSTSELSYAENGTGPGRHLLERPTRTETPSSGLLNGADKDRFTIDGWSPCVQKVPQLRRLPNSAVDRRYHWPRRTSTT